MSTSIDFDHWINYINNHPNKKIGVVGNGIERRSAPYKDIFVRGDTDSGLVIFYKGSPNHWHRLDGPAVIERSACYFYIEDVRQSREEYERHPAVIEYNLSRIISEVLSED